jgi:hypothetical protein
MISRFLLCLLAMSDVTWFMPMTFPSLLEKRLDYFPKYYAAYIFIV